MLIPLITLLVTNTACASPVPAATKDELIAQREYDLNQSDLDRAELITPSSPKFKPTGRGLRLRLLLKDSDLKIGSPIRYRLEMINESSSSKRFSESPSFFKSGRLPNLQIMLQLTLPNGSTTHIRSPFETKSNLGGDEIKFPDNLNDDEKQKRFDDIRRRSSANQKLFVELAPGEVLRTRGDSLGDSYRTLSTMEGFKIPGRYKLQVILGWYAPPMVRSNIVSFNLRE